LAAAGAAYMFSASTSIAAAPPRRGAAAGPRARHKFARELQFQKIMNGTTPDCAREHHTPRAALHSRGAGSLAPASGAAARPAAAAAAPRLARAAPRHAAPPFAARRRAPLRRANTTTTAAAAAAGSPPPSAAAVLRALEASPRSGALLAAAFEWAAENALAERAASAPTSNVAQYLGAHLGCVPPAPARAAPSRLRRAFGSSRAGCRSSVVASTHAP
jgi:hypothetical protein